jgi:hypothetical protein
LYVRLPPCVCVPRVNRACSSGPPLPWPVLPGKQRLLIYFLEEVGLLLSCFCGCVLLLGVDSQCSPAWGTMDPQPRALGQWRPILSTTKAAPALPHHQRPLGPLGSPAHHIISRPGQGPTLPVCTTPGHRLIMLKLPPVGDLVPVPAGAQAGHPSLPMPPVTVCTTVSRHWHHLNQWHTTCRRRLQGCQAIPTITTTTNNSSSRHHHRLGLTTITRLRVVATTRRLQGPLALPTQDTTPLPLGPGPQDLTVPQAISGGLNRHQPPSPASGGLGPQVRPTVATGSCKARVPVAATTQPPPASPATGRRRTTTPRPRIPAMAWGPRTTQAPRLHRAPCAWGLVPVEAAPPLAKGTARWCSTAATTRRRHPSRPRRWAGPSLHMCTPVMPTPPLAPGMRPPRAQVQVAPGPTCPRSSHRATAQGVAAQGTTTVTVPNT